MLKYLATSALLWSAFAGASAQACWSDGTAAGEELARQYCLELSQAVSTLPLSLGQDLPVSLCAATDGRLACKEAMDDAVAADRHCFRLWSMDYAGDSLEREGYTARSLYSVFSEECSHED